MRILILILSTVFLAGCGLPINFNADGDESPESPDWVSELSSRVDEGEKKESGKVRSPKKGKEGKGRKPKVDRRIVHDMVTPKVVVPEVPVPKEKPQWVEDLEEEVTVKKIGKQQKSRPINAIVTDLVAEKTPKPKEKRVSQGPAKVDIIFVVDSSHSMRPFLRKVENTFAGFIPALASLDWRIMFTTADHGDHGFFLANWASRNGSAMPLENDGRVVYGQKKYLDKKTNRYQSIFMDTLRLHDYYEYREDNGGDNDMPKSICSLPPYCQGWNEQPLKALKAAFSANRSLFRPDADVAAIIFSDSDEGEFSDPADRISAQDTIKAFQGELGRDGKKLVGYGIIMIPVKDEACVKKYSVGERNRVRLFGEGLFGTELARLAELTGGKNYSLCKSNYTPLARKIVFDFSK